jgi:hypothetical protein
MFQQTVEQASGRVDTTDRTPRRGVTGQVHDARDLVAHADRLQGLEVSHVSLLCDDGQISQLHREIGRTALDDDAALAAFAQRPHRVPADEARSASYKNHGACLSSVTSIVSNPDHQHIGMIGLCPLRPGQKTRRCEPMTTCWDT